MNARHLKRAKSNDQYEKLQEVNNNDIRFFFFLSGFSLTDIHESQDCRGAHLCT